MKRFFLIILIFQGIWCSDLVAQALFTPVFSYNAVGKPVANSKYLKIFTLGREYDYMRTLKTFSCALATQDKSGKYTISLHVMRRMPTIPRSIIWYPFIRTERLSPTFWNRRMHGKNFPTICENTPRTSISLRFRWKIMQWLCCSSAVPMPTIRINWLFSLWVNLMYVRFTIVWLISPKSGLQPLRRLFPLRVRPGGFLLR